MLGNFLEYTIYTSKDGTLAIKVLDVIIILVAYILTLIILKIIFRVLMNRVEKENKPKVKLIFNFFKYFVICLVFIFSLDALGIKMTSLLLGSSALFLGLGLGLQRVFQDIISGIIIFMDKSIHVGHIIEIDGKKGKVFEINLRTTRLKTIENKILIVPNHRFLDDNIYNWNQNGELIRECVEVGVAYGSDVRKVEGILLESLKGHKGILSTPLPNVVFNDFADSALIFKLNFYLKEGFSSDSIKSDIRFQIFKLFNKKGIKIPFPQRDLHILR